METLNRITTTVFDVVLAPFELVGPRTALVVVSGVFGVLALLAFKHISWQKGIKQAKDKIKGHMIEIRIYQDDLVTVGSAVGKVLWKNLQYVSLNFGPFIPLIIPFAFVAAQLVVRYAYDPVPVTAAEEQVRPGQGTLIEVGLDPERRLEVAGLTIELPAGVRAVSPLVRAPSEGRAFQEVIATEPGEYAITVRLQDGTEEVKTLVAGAEPTRHMQPRRVSASDWYALTDPDRWSVLWPAEPLLAKDSPVRSIVIAYPYRDLGWMPGGEIGILVTFVLASMLFGFVALKPLGVQI